VLLFVLYAYLQWVVVNGARAGYLQRTGHAGVGGDGVLSVYFVMEAAIAVALAAVNATWVQFRQLRVAR
jgi:hypothetical protein